MCMHRVMWSAQRGWVVHMVVLISRVWLGTCVRRLHGKPGARQCGAVG